MNSGYKEIADYGLIGNLETCALVGKDGSIDWLCLPDLDSPSVFAAILDAEKGGSFSLRPAENFESRQAYIADTNVLQTIFKTPSGSATLTDFMPIVDEEQKKKMLIRKVGCAGKATKFKLNFNPKFNYATSKSECSHFEGVILAKGMEGRQLFLSSFPEMKFSAGDEGASVNFNLDPGDTAWFVLSYDSIFKKEADECFRLLQKDIGFWKQWNGHSKEFYCNMDEKWREAVARSGLVLKLLSDIDFGSVAAAPTTSLPEVIGGVRNWDYRYAWLRDMSFTVQALFHLGHVREFHAFHDWIYKIIKLFREPVGLQPVYKLNGTTDLGERKLDHLSGYRDSRPVMIGNRAASQLQLDIHGELMGAIYEAVKYDRLVEEEDWGLVKRIIRFLCANWEKEDFGIWEVKDRPRHFVYSKVMCWMAIDKGIRIAELKGAKVEDEWRRTRDRIKEEVLKKGFSEKKNSFIRSFGSEDMDATGLLIANTGFLPFQDEKIQGTINAVMSELMVNGCLVYRYIVDDGLPGREGPFIVCSFWLIRALAASGRLDEAERIFDGILKYASPLGLLSEEIDPETGKLLGNYPQAYSHIGLINSALYLCIAKGGQFKGPKPTGL